MARVTHPNVVTVHDVGEHDGRVYVAMEFVEGQTLAQWLNAERRSWREVLEVCMLAGQGPKAAHARAWSTATSSPAMSWSRTRGR